MSVQVAGRAAATPAGSPDPSLARTGVEVGFLLLLAVVALVVGWGLRAAARRVRRSDARAEI